MSCMNFKKFYLNEGMPKKEGSKFCDFYSLGNQEGIRVFNKRERDNLDFIKNAFEMNKLAYEKGILVPEPYGLVEATINEKSYLGIHLRDLGQITLEDVPQGDFEDARDSWIKQVVKANIIGFSCNDSNKKRNAIWVPEERKTYLIDCDFWKYNGKGWNDFN